MAERTLFDIRQSEAKRELAAEYEALGVEFKKQVSGMKQPLAHGTTSEHLESILKHGLGAVMPDTAFDGSKSATDLKSRDGLLGAYAFARMDTRELKIRSEELTGEDLIARYVRVNPNLGEQDLRRKFQVYKEAKDPQGYPVVLIYDGEGSVEVRQRTPRIPSEVIFEGSVDGGKLRIVLAPETRIEEVRKLLETLQIRSEIKPIEILEVTS